MYNPKEHPEIIRLLEKHKRELSGLNARLPRFAGLRPMPPPGSARVEVLGRAFMEVLGDPPRPINNKE